MSHIFTSLRYLVSKLERALFSQLWHGPLVPQLPNGLAEMLWLHRRLLTVGLQILQGLLHNLSGKHLSKSIKQNQCIQSLGLQAVSYKTLSISI